MPAPSPPAGASAAPSTPAPPAAPTPPPPPPARAASARNTDAAGPPRPPRAPSPPPAPPVPYDAMPDPTHQYPAGCPAHPAPRSPSRHRPRDDLRPPEPAELPREDGSLAATEK